MIGAKHLSLNTQASVMSEPDQASPFRAHIPDLSIPRFTSMKQLDPYQYAAAFKEGGIPPWLHGLYLHWRKLLAEPFKGVTSDGM